MKEWICRELSTSTSDDENGILMMETELIRCKDCKAYNGMKCVRNNMIAVRAEDFCSRAERKEE